MYPPLLMLNQPMAKSMIDYRTDRLKAAENRAMTYGYSGAMFLGNLMTKVRKPHQSMRLQASLSIISRQILPLLLALLQCQPGQRLANEEGYPVLEKIANFWTSRSVKNADGTYSINYVIAADEYAEGIDDNAYTNAAAKKALEYATLAAKICGKKAPEIWQKIGENLVFAKMKNGVTQEYKGYDGQMIKQADVNLLAYPLGVITDPSQIKKDLEYYSGKVDQNNGRQ